MKTRFILAADNLRIDLKQELKRAPNAEAAHDPSLRLSCEARRRDSRRYAPGNVAISVPNFGNLG